jgi:hypothetical protein
MDEDIKSKIEKLRCDFSQIKGQPFTYFYCPILFRDEDTDICKAHIVNVAFHNSPKTWTIQRKDVDNFYGSNFESEFVALQYKINKWSPGDIITDTKISKIFRPKLLIGDKNIDHFKAQGKTPTGYTRIELENEKNQRNIQFILKVHPEDFTKGVEKNFEIEINKDFRLPALVSLIKSAHLTLFEMLGYRYAFSAGGNFVGHQILGKFYIQNCKQQSKSRIIKNASSFFNEFFHMVRPIQSCGMDFQGTISDNQLLVCKESKGTIWALIVFIRTMQQLHSVMIPCFDEPSAIVKFTDFLKNENDTIEVNLCHFEPLQDQWVMSKKSFHLFWPKEGIIYQ